MKIQKDMNRYKFQMGAELPPEMMQQMQGMPMEQGIQMEQGVPVEQGNGEASFAQQLMAIEQEIDKIQKEMKKLEKRDDRLAQNEYKRLEQQLMQLEQQKEMLRQQVEATRQQLEAQEQMQGEEYLDPNAQYEMSPEELDALEGQYQDVPMEEQINPEEMQMMQYGGKMQRGNTKLVSNTKPIPLKLTDQRTYSPEIIQRVTDYFWPEKPQIKIPEWENEIIEDPIIDVELKDKEDNDIDFYNPNVGGSNAYENYLYGIDDAYQKSIKEINPNDIIDSDHIDFYPDLYKNSHKFSIDPIVVTPNTRRDLLKQQRKDNFKKGIQKVKDYFGDRPLSDYAQLAIAAARVLDGRARLNNEIARNMTLTDNPYPRIMNNINEYSEGVKQAINREHAQRSNRLRNDIRRLESSVQPRSVFGRSANLMAMQDAYNENQNKLDADYQAKLAANEADRSKQYNAAFENFAETERANKIYNMNKLTNALEKDDKITANKYNLAQTELNRWGEIEQDRRDRKFLETQYLDNLYNNYYVNLLSAGIPNNKAIDIVDKLRQKNTKKSTKKSV